MYKICIVGAGFSGICAAVRLKEELNNLCTVTIFDRNSSFGGVWLTSTYPGCACEVPSHLYCFSWEPNPGWSKAYCEQIEILSYLQNIAQKHDLHSNAKFNHVVHEMRWDEMSKMWKVLVENKSSTLKTTEELNFDIIINAQGRFSSPEIPEEYTIFEGSLLHSAFWDKEQVQLEGQNILLIGCGASGSQIMPKIAETTKNIYIYQRNAPWVMPRTNFSFPSWVQWAFDSLPWVQKAYRNWIKWLFERNMAGFRTGSVANKIAPFLSKFHLWRQIKNPEIRKRLSPSYSFGCKRIVNSNEYYPTFNRQNVLLIDKKIIVEKHGFRSDVDYFPIDVIILATGFQVQNLFGQISVIGKKGADIPKIWNSDKPRTYLSMMSSKAPNFFFLLGPNASTGYTSIILQLETQVEWVLKVIQELIYQTSRVITVTEIAEQTYMQILERNAKKTIFGSQQCLTSNSWYLNSKGDVVEIYPGSTADYKNQTANIIRKDFEFY